MGLSYKDFGKGLESKINLFVNDFILQYLRFQRDNILESFSLGDRAMVTPRPTCIGRGYPDTTRGREKREDLCYPEIKGV